MGFRATLNSVVWLVTHTTSDRNGGGERWVLEKKTYSRMQVEGHYSKAIYLHRN